MIDNVNIKNLMEKGPIATTLILKIYRILIQKN